MIIADLTAFANAEVVHKPFTETNLPHNLGKDVMCHVKSKLAKFPVHMNQMND